MGTIVDFKRPDGKACSGYYAEPEKGGKSPGIVVIQEWWGLNDQIKGVADRMAQAGYRVLVPDLYRGKVALEAKEAEHLMKGLNFGDAAGQDIRGAVQYLKQSGPKVAVMGFCMGGTIAFLAACKLNGLSAAVCYYGGQIAKNADEKPKVPTQMHFGDQDASIPMTDVETIKKKRGGDSEIYVYAGAGHGFHCDERGSFHEASAKTAWQRAMDFLNKHVKK